MQSTKRTENIALCKSAHHLISVLQRGSRRTSHLCKFSSSKYPLFHPGLNSSRPSSLPSSSPAAPSSSAPMLSLPTFHFPPLHTALSASLDPYAFGSSSSFFFLLPLISPSSDSSPFLPLHSLPVSSLGLPSSLPLHPLPISPSLSPPFFLPLLRSLLTRYAVCTSSSRDRVARPRPGRKLRQQP